LDIGRKCEKKYKSLNYVDDEIIIDLVRKEITKYEKEHVNYIVEGFPKNRVISINLNYNNNNIA